MYLTSFGDRRAMLRRAGPRKPSFPVLGDTQIDASAGAGTGATVTFIALAGEAVIRVAPGSRVSDGGFSLFGDREIEVSPGDGPRSASTRTRCLATWWPATGPDPAETLGGFESPRCVIPQDRLAVVSHCVQV